MGRVGFLVVCYVHIFFAPCTIVARVYLAPLRDVYELALM